MTQRPGLIFYNLFLLDITHFMRPTLILSQGYAPNDLVTFTKSHFLKVSNNCHMAILTVKIPTQETLWDKPHQTKLSSTKPCDI